MKELLQKAQDLVDGLLAKTAEVNKQALVIEERERKVERDNEALRVAAAKLKEREDAIRDVENAQAVLEQAKILQADVAAESQKLDAAKSAFAQLQAKHNEAAQILKRDQEVLVNDRALLRKQEDELKERQQTYKEEVLKKLQAGV